MYVSHLSCPKCSKTYESEKLIQLCECGAPLLVEYDLSKVQAAFKKEMLKDREPNLWRLTCLTFTRRSGCLKQALSATGSR